MDAIKAVCPKCSTQYKLTPEQLTVANGQVRCGVCMTVFKAVPDTAGAKPQTTPPPQAKQPPQQAKAPAARTQRPQREGQSSFVNDADEKLLNDTGIRKSFDKPSSFDTGEFDSVLDNLGDTHAGKGSDDFILSDELENHDAESGDLSPNNLPPAKKSDQFRTEELTHAEDESWASDLIDDDSDAIEKISRQKDTPFPEKQGSRSGPPKKPDEPRKALGSSKDDFDFEADLEGLDLGAPLALTRNEEEDLGFGTSEKDELINRIPPEPMVLHLFASDSLLLKILYGSATFLALVLFVFQIFYFQFDTLSRNPEWRSFYQMACSTLGCELPQQYSIDDIKTQHLSVKSHPYYKQSLIVDAIIINHANILQPFPLIELYFTDNSQRVVAARQFEPKEYLRGELASTDLMPSKQSVHIALDISDPGSNATGYSIELRYPN